MGKHIWAIAFSACLVAYTAYAALDTFAFAEVYQENATEANTSMFDGVSSSAASSSAASSSGSSASSSSASSASSGKRPSAAAPSSKGGPGGKRGASSGSSSASSGAVGASSGSSSASSSTIGASSGGTIGECSDDDVSVTVSSYDVSGTTAYVADVTVSSAEYLKTAFANDSFGKNVTATTSQIASAHNAVLAINGDNYGSRERGYVIRNGVVYRDAADDSDVLCVYADGTLKIVDASTATAQELVDAGVWQAFSFGPALVEGGSVSVSQSDEVGRAMASNPRTAIGIIDANHYVFVVSDGRTGESEGLSLYELAQFMQQKLGVSCAYNLDGGGSSTMVFKGSVVNNPTTNGNHIEERKVNDIVYIG